MPKINKKILIDLGIIVILITGLFPFTSSGSGVAPNIVGTTNDTNAILGTRQWKSFYTQGRFWVFYCTGGNWGYKSSTDGSTNWTGFTTVSACYNNEGWNISLYFDETTGFVHYWRYTGVLFAGDNTLYRRGTPNTGGTIAWPTGEQTVNDGGTFNRYAEGNITVDTNGYAFIWAKHYTPNNPWVFKNANNNGTWATAAGFPFQLNTGTTEWRGLIVPLTAGKMYAIYAVAGSTIRGRLWNGSSWEAVEEIDVADYPAAVDPGTQWGGVFSATAKGDDVYFAYLRATTNQVRFNKRTYGGSPAWAATDTLVQDSVTSASAPVITMKMDTGDVYVFWAGAPTANHIYYRKRTSAGVWDSSPTDWINESAGLTRNDKITGYFRDYGSKIGLVYQTGTSPWNIKFAALDFSADNVLGWAWSENIGWISFNNTTGGGTTNYGVNINPSTGIFSGYAWSRGTDADIGGVGWISFADFDGDGDIDAADKNISGSPCAPNCEAKLDFGTKQVSGWARALTDGGGWDGWIKLRGVTQTGAPYGVFWNSSTQEMEGWAWSDMVIGWISFNRVNCDPDKNGFSNGIGTCPSAGTPISNYQVVYGAATYTLTVSKSGTGSGTVNFNPPNVTYTLPHSETYNSGTSVTLTASAASGSTFAGWSGGGCSGTGTCVVTMSSIQTVTATFNLITPPTAAISCHPNGCSEPAGSCSGYPLSNFCLENDSTDPAGPADITKSEWDIFIWGGDPDSPCPSYDLLCDFTPSPISPGNYTVELYVEDLAGASATATKPFTILQDAIADFKCSLDNSTWKTCETIRSSVGERVYFLDQSTPSDGATITNWSWTFQNGTPDTATGTNPSSTFQGAGGKAVVLTITDNASRSNSKTHYITITLPFPGWEEIPPF